MNLAITNISNLALAELPAGKDFICPFSYKDLFLYAKKGDKIIITNDPNKIETLFPNLSWFETALPQAILQHKLGALSPTVQETLTYIGE